MALLRPFQRSPAFTGYVGLQQWSKTGKSAYERFNQQIAARYESMRDYIVAHYRMNQRTDIAFWRDNAANHDLSDNLKAMMTSWFTHKDIASTNRQSYSVPAYAPMSWHCLFAGYGTFPPESKMRPLPKGVEAANREDAGAMLASCASNIPPLSAG